MAGCRASRSAAASGHWGMGRQVKRLFVCWDAGDMHGKACVCATVARRECVARVPAAYSADGQAYRSESGEGRRAGARGGLQRSQRSQRSRDVGQRVCGSKVRTGMRVCLGGMVWQWQQQTE